MLTSTSSNQYLRPDYLNPLPTTLDSKKSPLALLAQTCSQIGSDSSTTTTGSLTNNKSSTSSSNNNNNESNSSLSIGKSKSTTNNKSHHHRDHEPRINNNSSKTLPPSSTLLKKSEDASSTNNKISCGGGQDPMSTEVNVTTSSAELDNNKNHSSKTPCSNANNSKVSTITPNPSPSSSTTSSSTPTNPTNKSPSTPVNSSTAADSTLSSSKSSHNVPVTLPFPTVLSSSGTKLNHTTNPSNFSNNTTNSSLDLIGLSTKHGNPAFPFPSLYPLPNSNGGSSTTLAPYLHSYARLKAAAAASAANGDSLLSSCRDPFCSGCQIGQGHGLKNACPIGCIQCDHVKTSFPSPLGFIPGFTLPPSLSSLYSNSQPYVCNWVVGDNYCLKRFSSPDDLLIHLKSHTVSSGTSNQEALQSLAAAAAAAAAGYPTLPFPSHSMLFGPTAAAHNFLSRTYPTPPLSPLGGTSRFHPYAKANNSLSPGVPTTGPFTPLGFSHLSHPAFSPYYPYSLYSQRLGGASANGSLHP